MRKRTTPLLVAFAVVLLTAAPDAMANHCVRCRFSVDLQWCVSGTLFGGTECEVDEFGNCFTTGECTHFSASLTPLSAAYEVASVERIDEAPAPDAALVAELDAPQPETTR